MAAQPMGGVISDHIGQQSSKEQKERIIKRMGERMREGWRARERNGGQMMVERNAGKFL